MKTEIYTIDGKTSGSIELPKCFGIKVRDDVLSKMLEIKRVAQPYAPAEYAGRQHSASGIILHRRHVWKSQYGRGISRVPRKIMSTKGSQFNWVAAEIPSVRGGRRAHPPRIVARTHDIIVNKKEMKLALASAISASADKNFVTKKYSSIDKIEKLPIVIESKVNQMKTKALLNMIKKILGDKLSSVAFREKAIRSGKGKMRGRKYKTSAGMLLVVAKDEKVKTSMFDVTTVQGLGINHLASGGKGRLTLYTEKAIKELGEKFK